jgi:hypothetical protein
MPVPIAEPMKFDARKAPFIPRIARGRFSRGGKTVLHTRFNLWQQAKDEQDPVKKAEAIKRFEEYGEVLFKWGEARNAAMDAGEKAVKDAGLEQDSKEGEELYRKAHDEYWDAHRVILPD